MLHPAYTNHEYYSLEDVDDSDRARLHQEHARRETLLNITRTAISWLTDYPTALSDTQVHQLARIAHHATANHENSEEWHMLRELFRLAVREEQDRDASYECPNCGGDIRDHYHRQVDVDWFEKVYYDTR